MGKSLSKPPKFIPMCLNISRTSLKNLPQYEQINAENVKKVYKLCIKLLMHGEHVDKVCPKYINKLGVYEPRGFHTICTCLHILIQTLFTECTNACVQMLPTHLNNRCIESRYVSAGDVHNVYPYTNY